VWEIPGTETFVVSSAKLVNEAVARPDDFSSNLASLVYRGDDGRPCVFDMAALGDATHVLATADPPVHTGHRKLLQPHLTPACAATLETDIAAIVDELLAAFLTAGGGDVVSVLAEPLPMRVIGRVIGLPVADTAMLLRLVLDTDEILAGVGDSTRMQRAAEAAMDTGTYLAGQLARAVQDPNGATWDTMLAVLARAVAAETMTFDEAVGILVQLLGAGSETTTSLIATAIRLLADDAPLQERLRADPGRVPAFLEEALRLDGPFRFHYRTTRHPTELGGVAIPAGARLLLMWAAANLDHAAFPNPEQLDIDRAFPKAHLAFGRGIHFCIGAPLARLETRIAIERLLHHTTGIRLDAARPARHHPNIFLRRLAQLGVTVST
jgi:cytochrome P450